MTSQASEQIKEVLAANVRLARDSREFSQRALAVEMDVSEMQISRWERGIVAPNHLNLTKLARVLGREIGWFYEDHSEAAAA